MKRVLNLHVVGVSPTTGNTNRPLSVDVAVSLIETKTPGPVASMGKRVHFNGTSGNIGNIQSKRDAFVLVHFKNEGWTETSLFNSLYAGVSELLETNVDSVAIMMTNKDMWSFKEAVLERVLYSLNCVETEAKEGYIPSLYLIVPDEYKEEVAKALNAAEPVV